MGHSFNEQVIVASTFLLLIEKQMKPREEKEYRQRTSALPVIEQEKLVGYLLHWTKVNDTVSFWWHPENLI